MFNLFQILECRVYFKKQTTQLDVIFQGRSVKSKFVGTITFFKVDL
ncbi:hypothetical protein LEP1GSC041_4515 [Leptospira noguchii str. 2006001870]|nr:hypothetical protein LEP1GSC041_4515 [Leptospira noguchii str. 2006001870]